MVFLNPKRGAKPGGAVVIGLGPVGELLPGRLTQALTNGLLEYARSREQCPSADGDESPRLSVSALLVGTGFTGLTVEVGVRCLLTALLRSNEALAGREEEFFSKTTTRIGSLTVYEELQGRAIAAVQALRDIVRDAPFADSIDFDGRLCSGVGGYRGRSVASGGHPGSYRVTIVGDQGGLRFTLITDRARNEVAAEPDQRQAVDGLISSITNATQDQPGLSRAIFELMVPNGMKEAVAEVRTLMMSVDAAAASYPWEMMRDGDLTDPLCTRIELVRQLASSKGRGRVPIASEKRVFIVGDTQSGRMPLSGAQAEARVVASAFGGRDYEVTALYRANAQQVFEALFCGGYRFMHLAGHGVVRKKDDGPTGMVLGPDTYLTSAQVSKLRHVPDFVFINCCHLGDMRPEAQPRWGELAANLATQFIEVGCKAVIAAGWAVDDGAADTFAQTFYAAMLRGERFGQALLKARAATYQGHRLSNTNTWGAYQAYGDERYTFPGTNAGDRKIDDYVHASHVVADLERLHARLQDATAYDRVIYYRKEIEAIENAVRGPDFQNASVREKLASVWADLGNSERAIGHYRAALLMEDAGSSLKALEQLANLEIRYGASLRTGKDEEKHALDEDYMEQGSKRLQLLIDIGTTVERLSLLGSYWKRHAQIQLVAGDEDELKKSLREMCAAYWSAAKHARQHNGEWDYYPLLNALDGELLLVARGLLSEDDLPSTKLSSLLQAAIENARRRFAEDRSFFHALAEVEAKRVDALWACYDGRVTVSSNDCQGLVLAALSADYVDLLKRLGSARENDSATTQQKFLIAMLPDDDKSRAVKEALQALVESIEKASLP
jgi:hypothetical protein